MTSMYEVSEEGRAQHEAWEFQWHKDNACVARYHLRRLFRSRNEVRDWVDATGYHYTTADLRRSVRALCAMARRDDARWLAER